VFLIDWGEGGPSSLYDDFGRLAFYFDLDKGQKVNLLSLYYGRTPTEKEIHLLEAHGRLAEIHEILWQFRKEFERES
jgi:hypothetical protein